MDTVIRIAIIYVLVLAGMRMLGKREFSQLAPMEFIALLLIPEIVSQGMTGDDSSLTNALVGVATLFLLVYATSILTHLSPRAETIVESGPTVLAHDGRFVEAHLNRERVSPEEIYAEIRKAGLERIDQTRWVILERDGKIAIVPV